MSGDCPLPDMIGHFLSPSDCVAAEGETYQERRLTMGLMRMTQTKVAGTKATR